MGVGFEPLNSIKNPASTWNSKSTAVGGLVIYRDREKKHLYMGNKQILFTCKYE